MRLTSQSLLCCFVIAAFLFKWISAEEQASKLCHTLRLTHEHDNDNHCQAGKRPLKTRKDFIYHYNGIISEHEGKYGAWGNLKVTP